ncbi:MAG TPA: chloride channel protein [Phycisphaerae bacterium]|nr:chloride channel protein [Phycisphaerae bacterium]
MLHRLASMIPKPAARWSRLFGLGVLVGVIGGLAEVLFAWGVHAGTNQLIGRVTHLGGAETLHFDWRVLIFPAIGGLISGLLVRYLCPGEAKGHGTDLLISAFHHRFGILRLRGPTVKAAANVAIMACGGSAGPEGPSAALGAAIGSSVGGLFRLTARERRVMLVAGCAAAVGAIFRCPLGGALFATSILYSEEEFESDAIVPAFVASVIGYSVFMSVWGGLGRQEYLLEGADKLAFDSIFELGAYAILGPLCGLAAIFFVIVLRYVERSVTPRLPVPRAVAPALGGLATGAIACILPQVMDGHYAFIQNAMNGFDLSRHSAWSWAGLFAAVCLFKPIATATTVGSGGSGGALGPSVFIGGVVGALWGALLGGLSPSFTAAHPDLRPALIAVGMGGVLAATMRTPLASIVMVTEMTGSYGLIVPLMLVCMSAYVVGRRWGLNQQQLRSMAQSPAHAGDAIVHMLESWRVAELMERDWPETVAPNTPLREMVTRIQPGTRPVFAVAENGFLRGVISTSDIRRITEDPLLAEAVIASDIMTTKLITAAPDVDLYEAMNEFRRSEHNVLPVVREDGRWLGMLLREKVFESVRKNIAASQRAMLHEHAGLAAMNQEGEIQQLVTGLGAAQKDRVSRLMVPMDAVGKTIREADFRRTFGAHVIAVEQPDGSVTCPPDLNAPLSSNQRLLAIMETTSLRGI